MGMCLHSHSESLHIQRRQEWTHSLRRLLRLALDHRRRAHGSRARGRRCALGRWRALDFRATGSRARRALTCRLLAHTVINDDRLRLRDATLQNVLAQIRNRRALRLQHIQRHIRCSSARRHLRLQNVLAHIRFNRTRARCNRRRCRALWSRIWATARPTLPTRFTDRR